jgi:hypothetical protein
VLSNNGFTEGTVRDLEFGSPPSSTAEGLAFTDEYDYASDSDLDEFEGAAVSFPLAIRLLQRFDFNTMRRRIWPPKK